MKPEPPELARIVEDQCAPALVQDEVIVFAGLEAGWCHAQSPGHAEMDAEPELFGKTEEHLLAECFGFWSVAPGRDF